MPFDFGGETSERNYYRQTTQQIEKINERADNFKKDIKQEKTIYRYTEIFEQQLKSVKEEKERILADYQRDKKSWSGLQNILQ